MKNINYIFNCVALTIAMCFATLPSCNKFTEETPTVLPEQTEEQVIPQEKTYEKSPVLNLDEITEIYAYNEETVEIPFNVLDVHEDISNLKINVTSPKCYFLIEKLAYNAEEMNGILSIKVQIGKNLTSPVEAGNIELTLSYFEGKSEHNLKYTVKITPYYFKIETKDFEFNGEKDQVEQLSFETETNIPDFKIQYSNVPEWIKIEENKLTVTQENTTSFTRSETIHITLEEGDFESYFKISQGVLPPENKEGYVQFADRAFKNVCLELSDSDKDGDVSFEEALTVTEINAVASNIKDLSGLDAFKNIWKLNLKDNDIVNANILCNLNNLRWLDLRGNVNLESFDVRDCCEYFDYCRFDVSEKLNYKYYRGMVNVCSTDDTFSKYATVYTDERTTKDWSRHEQLVPIQQHTKGNGKIKFIFSGIGYIDIDMEDGTFDRLMKATFSELVRLTPCMAPYWDYIDVYYLEYLNEKHLQWIPEEMNENFEQIVENNKENRNEYNRQFKKLKKSAYIQSTGCSENDWYAVDEEKDEPTDLGYLVHVFCMSFHNNLNYIQSEPMVATAEILFRQQRGIEIYYGEKIKDENFLYSETQFSSSYCYGTYNGKYTEYITKNLEYNLHIHDKASISEEVYGYINMCYNDILIEKIINHL